MAANSGNRTGVRIVVAGDQDDFYPDCVPITIIDTSSRLENKAMLSLVIC